jgi:hypothetical protein
MRSAQARQQSWLIADFWVELDAGLWCRRAAGLHTKRISHANRLKGKSKRSMLKFGVGINTSKTAGVFAHRLTGH